MSFKKLYIILAAAAFLLPLGCDKDKETDTPEEQPVVGAITLASDEAVVLSDEGGSASVAFKATKGWTASASESWLGVEPASGDAADILSITLTAIANETYDERTATLTLTCEKDVKTLSVIQKQKGALLLTRDNFDVEAAGGSVTVVAKANADVQGEITAGADWISEVKTKGLTEYTFEYTVAENAAYEKRTGTIVFSNTYGSETVTITQAAAEKPVEDPFGGALEMITATTTWAGSVFDAIVTSKAGADAKEWTSPDGENFIDAKLGYLAGSTTSVDETTGEEKVTYGKFKFKINENAGIGNLSRVQTGGTGVLGERNNLVFKVDGPGAMTVIARSSGDAARAFNVAVNGSPVTEEGWEAPGKAENAKTFSFAVEAAEGDLVYLYSMSSGINFYSIKWVPGGKPEDPDDPDDPDDPQGELKAVTETTSWASVFTELVAKYPADSYPDGVTESFIYGNLGFVTGGGKFKFGTDNGSDRAQLGGTGNPGTKNTIQFKVAGSGALTVLARSSGDAARPLKVAVGTKEIGSQDVPDKTGEIATCSFEVSAAEGDLVNIYSGSSGINVYDIRWVPGGSVDPGDNPNPPTPGENDELDCPDPPTVGTVELDKLYGYAAGVTGGEGATSANVLHFDNGKALQTWLLARTKTEKKGDHSPVIIWLSGTFGPEDGRDFSEAHPWFDVKDVSNLSFYGTDGFVMDRIGIFCVRASNIIIRNINFQQPKANNGADAVSMQECDGVWVDHCTFTSLNQTKDYEDGSTDITHGSKNVTVSWCHYVKTQKSCLVGHSNSQSGDTQITATFHHNWFEGSSSRHPRVRFGQVHVYNNFFDGNTTYGVGSAYGARVLVEYNYFDGVHLPTDICTYPAKQSGSSWVSNLTGSVAGYLWATQDVYVNKPSNASNPYPFTNVAYTKYGGTAGTALTYADFKPAYDYKVTAAEEVPAVVQEGSGYGKLGWTEAPVAVNNGGITEFDSTDDNPTDPDPDDPDDPDEPGDGAAHTYTVSMQSKAVVQTQDGAAGATYFDTSTSVADFSKDYSGSFTIDGTTYTQGFKMDSKGYVNFTTSSEFTTTLQFYFVRRKSGDTGAKMQLIPDGGDAQIWETPYDTYADSGVLTLEKGKAYTIKQKTSEQALILVVVKETE